MAAQAWSFYNEFKKYMADNTIDMDNSIFRIALFTSASNAATATFTLKPQVNNEVANGSGYLTSGKTLSATTWASGASASEWRFDSTAVFWSANGGNIANIKFAVIFLSAAASAGRYLVCYSSLTSTQFTLTDGNRLTITPSANGIFELN